MNIRFSSFLIFLSTLFICLSCIKESDDTDYPYLEKEIAVGDRIPEFVVYEKGDRTGASFSSDDFSGKTSILLFFNTGCGDCQREMPKIDRICKALQDDPDYQVIAIARDQAEGKEYEAMINYWEEEQFTMPKYVDPGRKVYTLFANQTVPRIYLINPERMVVWMAVEELLISEEELLDLIYHTDAESKPTI